MSSSVPVNNQDDICQRCTYTRWAHENATDILPGICTNFEEPRSEDPLTREPDFDFAEFMRYCEDTSITKANVDIAFVMWLHTRSAKV
jgi:hypothetical protein